MFAWYAFVLQSLIFAMFSRTFPCIHTASHQKLNSTQLFLINIYVEDMFPPLLGNSVLLLS